MHELAITQAIVEAVESRAGSARVVRVRIEIGKLSLVLPDAVRMAFDLCAEGTALEGASLEIDEPPGVGRCRSCERESVLDRIEVACAFCGSSELAWLSGDQLRVLEMEVS